MSRQRKVVLSLMLMTGGGFGVDKLFFDGAATGPSASAAAESVAPAGSAKSESASVAKGADSSAQDLTHLARLFAEINVDADGGRQDAFAIPRTWKPEPEKATKEKPVVTSAEAAATSLKVTAMTPGAGLIIGGRYQAIGEVHDGIVVVSVDAEEAVIRHVASATQAKVHLAVGDQQLRDRVKVSVSSRVRDQ